MRVLAATTAAFAAPGLAQVWPRQTSAFSNSTSSIKYTSTTISPDSAVTPPPCCWIIGGFVAVSFNTWYEKTYSDLVATVITTILQYDDTTVVANSSTKCANATFNAFGFYAAGSGGSSESVCVSGVPTTVIPNDLLAVGHYAGTSVYAANATIVFSRSGAVIASPTPYAQYDNVGIATWTPTFDPPLASQPTRYDAEMCGIWTTESRLQYADGSWAYTAASILMPYTGVISNDAKDSSATISVPMLFTGHSLRPFAVALPTDLPMEGVYLPMPTDAWNSIGDITASYLYISECWNLGGTGEPTVHVPVTQLTSTSSHAIVMSGALSTTSQSTVTAPTSSQASSSVATRTSTASTSTAESSRQAPAPGISTPTQSSRSVPSHSTNEPKPATPSSSAQQPADPQPEVVSTSQVTAPDSGTTTKASQQPTTPTTTNVIFNILSIITQIGGQDTTSTSAIVGSTTIAGPATTSPVPAATIPPPEPGAMSQLSSVTIGSKVLTLQPAGTSAVIIGDQTLTVGGSAINEDESTISLAPASGVVVGSETLAVGGAAVTQSGQTISLAASSRLVVNGETLSISGSEVTQNGRTISLAAPSLLVVNGQTASAIPTPTVLSGEQIVTVGTQTYTASGVSQTGIVIAGQTIFPGTSTVIAGATVNLSSGNLVIASGTSTAVVSLTATISGDQTITLGTRVYTASVIQTSAVVLGGNTIVPGMATIIGGETVSLAGSQLIVASGSQTSTVGLGGAIMSGIGGQASTTSVESYTGREVAQWQHWGRAWAWWYFRWLSQ